MKPSSKAAPRVAVIGGGIAGLTCARALAAHGVELNVFDKARKPGGRLCTRRTEDGRTFDHGAQYFTIRDPWFRRALAPLIDEGVVAPWTGRVAVCGPEGPRPPQTTPPRWVGVPTMSALPRALARDLPVQARTRVTDLRPGPNGWALHDADDRTWGGFDRVVVAIPAGQAAALLDACPELQRVAQRASMAPCWVLMATVEPPEPVGYDGAFIEDSPLSWAMRQPSKPGRPPTETWVLHASAAWTERHWDDEPDAVVTALLEAWAERGGPARARVSAAQTHRWRYARVDPHPPSAVAHERGVALAGDWLRGGRVEGAFASGRTAAAAILRSLRGGSRATA